MTRARPVLLLFLDGVGIGEPDADTNPFHVARLPTLRSLLGGGLPTGERTHHERASVVPLDAQLDTPGLPQSGTGQTALFTGFNAAKLHGKHYGPWVPTALRTRLGEESVLARAVQAGYDVAFANAYPEEVMEAYRSSEKLPHFLRAAPPLAALRAGLLTRHTPALMDGTAVASEIHNEGWRERLHRTELPRVNGRDAGANLARITGAHHLTLYAHYSTDTAGHESSMPAAVEALELVDDFLGGLLEHAPADLLTIIASDHGNIEDTTTGHTRNPALGMVIGEGHETIAQQLNSIVDVTPAILQLLGAAPSAFSSRAG